MNVAYNRVDEGDAVQVTTAHVHLPLYGRWTALHVTSYCVGQGTAITFGMRPSASDEIKHDRMNATLNGQINMSRGSGGNRQQFQQTVTVPNVIGQLLDWSTLNGGEVAAARTVCEAILRKVESIVETVRQGIRNNLGKNAKNQTLTVLGERYDKITKDAVHAFLKELNWPLMLQGAGLTTEAMHVVDYTLTHNPVDMFTIGHHDDTGIPLIQFAELKRFDRTTLANIKASNLLRKVCGNKLGDQFDKDGKIVIYEHDYCFVIAPGNFIDCTDPNGKTARLCIHTMGLSCNPIDEVVISYLHIRNKFDDWMKMSIAHGAEQGFRKARQ